MEQGEEEEVVSVWFAYHGRQASRGYTNSCELSPIFVTISANSS